jgi:hypothetical protein
MNPGTGIAFPASRNRTRYERLYLIITKTHLKSHEKN